MVAAAGRRLVRAVTSDCAALGLTEIARTIRERHHWRRRPTGALEDDKFRQVLTGLHTSA